MRATTLAVATTLLLLMAGCGGEDLAPLNFNAAPNGVDYLACDGLGTTMDEASMRAFRAHVPTGKPIRCATKTGFAFQGQTIELVFFAYGVLHDCPSGCFSSYACALDDGQQSMLFHASAIWGDESARSLPQECPALVGEEFESTENCNPEVSGRQHPIAQDAAFQAFLAAPAPYQFGFCAVGFP